VYRLLKLPFRNPDRAARDVAALVRDLAEPVQQRLATLLLTSPDPEQGLHYAARLRERQPGAFDRAAQSRDGLRHLVGVFTHSRFLSEELIENPGWIGQLLDAGELQAVLPAADLRNRLVAALPPGVPPPLEFARFRRRQILRILVRDIFGYATLPETTAELTTLADVIVDVACQRIHRALVARYGAPEGDAGLSVIALGKMGAEELNYSSDIDLMFVYGANGNTSGPNSITNKEFFKRAANQLTGLLSAYTAEGLCYRVDLRLRPDGSLGEVCISLEGARRYYAERARDWELQMLIKARAAAGDRETGRALLEFAEPLIYATSTDFSAIEQMSLTRERLNEKLAARHAAHKGKTPLLDVKLMPGGIRDIEFLVQCLQRLQGGSIPWVQHRGTLLALSRLHDSGMLKDADYGRLASAYQFLRHLEHRLQFDEDRQTHTLPEDPAALEIVARRMPGGGGSAKWLREQLAEHCAHVLTLYQRVIHAGSAAAEAGQAPRPVPAPLTSVRATLEQKAPALAAALARARMERGAAPFEYFLERISNDPRVLAALDRDAALTEAALDLFAHSPYFAEELIRHPESVVEVGQPPEALIRGEPPPAEPAGLRRWYRRAILRIEADSVCRSRPVFDTLSLTSELADAVITQAYRIAIAEVCGGSPQPRGQMWIVALGRLGMREFDLGSDADLTFVLPDAAASAMDLWTRVAERVVQLISAYTGEGVLFTVDTRLRPNGGAGPLVQTESAVTRYFRESAEAWESITYLKSRAVAGDLKSGEAFLHQLQQIYWGRYGEAGASRLALREMRARLEREQGAAHPLKSGRGGYYDIDFLLLYLRLKDAGVFYSVLNTLERIEVLENTEKLSHKDARFLREAATFYRALDHALRLLTGHAEGRLPQREAQLEALGALLPRWTPLPLAELDRIREQTRALYNRFFN
jgi:glutamate-ammonia-ligase adenylyltransferase